MVDGSEVQTRTSPLTNPAHSIQRWVSWLYCHATARKRRFALVQYNHHLSSAKRTSLGNRTHLLQTLQQHLPFRQTLPSTTERITTIPNKATLFDSES